MLQRVTLIIRLRRDPAAQDWYGQVEMVNPHREAAFKNRREMCALLEDWTDLSASELPDPESAEQPS